MSALVRATRWISLLAVLTLIAGACGRSSGESDNNTTTTSAATGAADNTFGSIKDVCGGSGAVGSTAQGVTSADITVGTFSDPGFSGRPGLNQELFDTAGVFADWCNANGGINGRKIVIDEHDSALFNTKAKMADACAKDFMLVGGGAVYDDSGVNDRLKCLLPDIAGYVVTPQARGADLLVQPVTNNNTQLAVGPLRYLQARFPAAVKSAGVLVGDLQTLKSQGQQNQEAAESFGWKFVYDDLYPVTGLSDWTPYAQGLKDKGVKGLIWIGEPETLAGLLKALANIGHSLDFVRADPNHYDQPLVELAGRALSNAPVFVPSVFYPFERAHQNPATRRYLALFNQYDPDGKSHAYLGLQAMSAWLLFAQAAKSCGADLTRKCVYDNAKKIHEWTGGGLHAKQDPGAATASQCYAIVQATANGFKLVDVKPNDGIYNCNPRNVYQLKGDYGQGATLADVGRKLSELK